jgi:hypothetical protein
MSTWQHVTVDIAKLRDYCLNPEHPRGKHKARVFETVLGLTARDAHVLEQALLDAVDRHREDMRPGVQDEYGQRYLLDFEMTTNMGTATIRSAWIVRTAEVELRLTTCCIK